MTCSCGHTMAVEAASQAEAVKKLKGMMNKAAVKAHLAEKHAGQPMMTVADVHAAIEKTTVLV